MNSFGYALGQLIGLAMFPAALIWFLRATAPGRAIWNAVAAAIALPRKRRALAEARFRHDRFAAWRYTIDWWTRERDHFPPGHAQHEAARDLVRYFELTQPPPCYCAACQAAAAAPRRP